MLLSNFTSFSQTFKWAKSVGGIFSDAGHSIITDGSSNVYVTGYYQGIVDFDPSPTDTFNLTSNGGEDVFIQKLDVGGNFIWAISMGGTSYVYGYSIILHAAERQ